MGPNRPGKHAKAQNKVIFSDKALKVFLTVALVIGFAPIAKDTAAAVAEQASGGFVSADSLVGGVSDSGTATPTDTVDNAVDSGANAEAAPIADEGEASDQPTVNDAIDGVSDSSDPADAPMGVAAGTEPDEVPETEPVAEEAEAEDPDEEPQDADEEEGALEGPENSFRYVDGVPIDELQASTFDVGGDARAAAYPTWDKSYGQNKYVYIDSSGKKITKTVSGSKAVGIDVSEHQGVIDWAKVKADGVKFAIIRVGYGSDYTAQDDKYFFRNVEGARANGIAIGVYLYSYATKATGTTGSAQSEANHVIRLLNAAGLTPSSLALPVYYDMEDDTQGALSPSQLGSIAETFCNAITAKGYRVGIYSNPTWWSKKLTAPQFNNSSWDRWVAQWGNFEKPQVSFNYGLWQFSSKGTVNGINGSVDMNFSFNEVGLKNTWVKNNGKWYYYGANGVPVKWEQWIDGSLYYFNSKGEMQTGWITWNNDKSLSYFSGDGKALLGLQKIGGATYYFSPKTGRSQKWEQWINGNLYYFNGSYKMVTGWVTWSADGTKSYFGSDGKARSGFQKQGSSTSYMSPKTFKSVKWEQWIDGSLYYFNGKGQMVTGWVTWKADGTKSYFGSNGKALTGLQKISGATYYFDPKTAKSQKWEQVLNGNLYYFNGKGQMVTGWVTWKADGTKSYFGSNGKALKGLQKISGATYYFDPKTAKSQKWEQWINGNLYYFNGKGQMVTGWVTWNADGTKSYFGVDGKAFKGFNKIGGYTYYFDPNTCKAKKWEQKINGAFYYFDSNCRMITGWVTWKADGTKSYFGSDGRAYSGFNKISGSTYYFDPSTYKAKKWEQWINGSLYYFNSSYQMHTGWLTWNSDKTKSYFAADGKALTGWQSIDKKQYYFDPKTFKALTGIQMIDGKKYAFGADASLVSGEYSVFTASTGFSLNTFAAAQKKASPSSLGYTQAQITAAMNPANSPIGSAGFYQFAVLTDGYSGFTTAAMLDNYIAKNTASRPSSLLRGKGQAFINAAKLYGVNEVYLLAHAILESGWGTSTLAQGYYYNGTTKINNKVYPKGTYYNFYGIGAYDSSPLSGGRSLAIQNGWNTPDKAIAGAADWISRNYLRNASYYQDTLYKMRWNYPSFKGTAVHQYATDKNWASSIAKMMAEIYAYCGVTQPQSGLNFMMPQYS
ncbi:hypothetical protein DMP11_08075 [Parvibacter caecicola]|nr:glucosaminidase domain-containing protein [Parvibacter caecicola]RNL09809.1 hypothetical protein DMP11_08075 [Parvibacter caecicola]